MKITLATVRALAERSGFSLVKTEDGYHIVEDDTGRRLPNAQGGTSHAVLCINRHKRSCGASPTYRGESLVGGDVP